VLEKLVENVDRAMQISEVIVDGRRTGEYKYEGNVANRALELVGKHIAVQAFTERVEHTGKDGGSIKYEEVSAVDRLTSRITGLAARTGSDGIPSKPH
jgi:hypothetical protein